jgi:7-carboxy-7-deazaguanine synthase
VLTGGEPMIAPGIHDLARSARAEGRHVTIETAGTIPPEGIECDLASLSPKLSNSDPDEASGWQARHRERRWQPEIVRAWLEGYDTQLKFVVRSEADLNEIREQLDRVGVPVAPENVLLMPEGTDVDTLHERGREVARLCRAHGYRFSPRLHIELWGNTRGT